MFRFIRSKVFRPQIVVLSMMVLIVVSLGVLGPAMARPASRAAADQTEGWFMEDMGA